MGMATALLGNRLINTPRPNTHTRQQWKMCLSGGMLLRIARQQRTNEDAG
jgi:hypothetical protein